MRVRPSVWAFDFLGITERKLAFFSSSFFTQKEEEENKVYYIYIYSSLLK